MDVFSLERNSAKIHKCLKRVDDTLVVVYPCKVWVPEKYFGTSLGSMTDGTISFIGIFGITVDDSYYAVSKALAMVTTSPSTTVVELVDNVKYMVFNYEKNDTFMTNVNLVKNSTLVGIINDEFIKYGKIPWYMTEDDLCTTFETSILHGGLNLKTNQAIIAAQIAIMTRTPSNKLIYYRHKPDCKERPSFIGFSNIAYTTTNTATRLFGNYYSDGVTSALVNESTDNEKIEDILR